MRKISTFSILPPVQNPKPDSRTFNRGVFLFFLYALTTLSLRAQPPAIEWDRTIGGSDFDALQSAKQTMDGGYILGGLSYSNSSGDKSENIVGGTTAQDYWVVKVDATGVKIWDKTYGGNSFDILRTVYQLSDGGYILGGHSYSNISGDKTENSRGSHDFWIVRIDTYGNKLWDKTIGSPIDDSFASMQPTSDGGFILGGNTSGNAGGDKTENSKGESDMWIVKVDASGNKQWDKTIGGSGSDGLGTIQQTSDGGYLLGGSSYSNISGDKTENSKGNGDFWIVKLDASGNKVWDKTIGGSGFDGLQSLQETVDGGYLLAGRSNSPISGDKSEAPKGGNDLWIVKIDANDNKLWDKTIGTTGLNNAAFYLASEGSSVVGGTYYSGIGNDKTEASRGNADYWVARLDVNGNIIWDKTLGGTGFDFLMSIQKTADNGYILGGYSDSPINYEKSANSKGSYDYWIIKMETDVCPTPATPVISPVSDDPLPVNTTFSVQATTSENNLTSATWDWGDGSNGAGTITGTTIDGNHTYATPGVYTITLTVENACGETAQSTYQYAVVYDPAAGFVTGGGWINSPAGAYVTDPSLIGKANFGFVSKYKKGATVPEGDTQFEFKAGNLNFKSTSYNWLVIAGARAQFKGNGTINGSGNYSFLLTVIDGQVSGGGEIDKFRIRIWGTTGLVYDNNVGSSEGTDDNASPSTALGGGSIVIHSSDNKKARQGFGTEFVALSDQLELTNYPNPTSDRVTFEFILPQGGTYQLDLLDMKGNRVQALKQGAARPGELQRVVWERGQTQKGIYITRLTTSYGIRSIKLLLE